MYQKFPKFMIDLMAKEYTIPETEINMLLHEFEKKGLLISLNENYFEWKREKKR